MERTKSEGRGKEHGGEKGATPPRWLRHLPTSEGWGHHFAIVLTSSTILRQSSKLSAVQWMPL